MPMSQEVPVTAGAVQPLPEDTLHCFQLQGLAMRTIFHVSPSTGTQQSICPSSFLGKPQR